MGEVIHIRQEIVDLSSCWCMGGSVVVLPLTVAHTKAGLEL